MVWFQCEDCGDNLKKPKLPNHFRICSASKLSCIDCGKVFGQQTVEAHTQCISEAEKYGPKGQGKYSNGIAANTNDNSKQKPDVDISVGLSERPPWFCSLCNTKATSKQTLLLHAEGKKHRAKARAFHAANQQPGQTADSTPKAEYSTEHVSKEKNPPEFTPATKSSEAENDTSLSSKKRKLETNQNDGARQATVTGTFHEFSNGKVNKVGGETIETKCQVKKTKYGVAEENEVINFGLFEDGKKKIKWKKLITSALRSNPDGVLKMRKLRKLVFKTLTESGIVEDGNHLIEMLVSKINSSSRFKVDGKYIHLVAKS